MSSPTSSDWSSSYPNWLTIRWDGATYSTTRFNDNDYRVTNRPAGEGRITDLTVFSKTQHRSVVLQERTHAGGAMHEDAAKSEQEYKDRLESYVVASVI